MKKNILQQIDDRINRAIEFLTVDIWRIRLEDLPFGKSFLIKQLRIFLLTVRGFDEDKCFFRASSLTFYTLLSVVPVMAMLFGIAKGFGFEKDLQTKLKQFVTEIPGQEKVLTKVIEYAESLLEATRADVIAGIGLALLFWSVVKVLGHIEASLNDIWEIKQSRSWGRKFSDYLAVMLIWVLFTVIYVLMPNTKVSFKYGLVAGIIAGTIFQIVQWGYISFQIGTTRYNAIYGSFAALPLFLLWLQISWWVVLFGAELSFAYQNVRTYEYEPDSLKVSPAFKRVLTLQVAHLLVINFANGERPLTDVEISGRLRIPIRLVHNILYDLVQSQVVTETRTKVDQQFGYQPARDINTLTIKFVVDAVEQNGSSNIPVARTAEFVALSGAIDKFREEMEASPANKLLKDI